MRHRASLPARRIVLLGIDQARPAPGVLDAVSDADVLILPPSNPVVSISPILAVPGVREAVRSARAPVVGVSPIISNRPVRGMADACLRAVGVDTSAAAVARLYVDFLDGWLVDLADADIVAGLSAQGIATQSRPLLMANPTETRAIAAQAVELALQLSA